MRVNYDHTDTKKCGSPKYTWANRGAINVPDGSSRLQIVRRVKKHLSLNGHKCDAVKTKGQVALRIRKVCQILFITYEEN